MEIAGENLQSGETQDCWQNEPGKLYHELASQYSGFGR